MNQKFTPLDQNDFLKIIRLKVNDYFDSNNKSKYGNYSMYLKSAFMFLLYFSSYLVVLLVPIEHPVWFLLLWVLIGCGTAGIGLSVMHDANHDAYSKSKWVNTLMGNSMNLIGANTATWKIQHNRLHHTYTNVSGIDEDISPPTFMLRFSPHDRRYWIHRFQFIYAWLLYGLMTLSWFTVKEFKQLYRYRKMGLIPNRKTYINQWIELIVWKLIYYTYMLVIPLMVLETPVWLTLLGFGMMHFTTGFILSIVFQTAHVMPECTFPQIDKEGNIQNHWALHEMMTTTNFAPSSRIFSWLIGGLNFQVEHHLFPKICHVHYKSISKIVEQTALEFQIPYHSQKNFMTALWNHAKMLYHLGRYDADHFVAS